MEAEAVQSKRLLHQRHCHRGCVAARLQRTRFRGYDYIKPSKVAGERRVALPTSTTSNSLGRLTNRRGRQYYATVAHLPSDMAWTNLPLSAMSSSLEMHFFLHRFLSCTTWLRSLLSWFVVGKSKESRTECNFRHATPECTHQSKRKWNFFLWTPIAAPSLGIFFAHYFEIGNLMQHCCTVWRAWGKI